jgi:hypothetical protein
MFEIECLIKSDYWILSIGTVDAFDCPFIGVSTIETGGSNGDFFACNPVYWHRKCYLRGPLHSGGIKSSPGRGSNGTMHI